MKISINCFSDSELKNIIASKKRKGVCEITNVSDAFIYDTESDLELVEPIIDLLSIFRIAKSPDWTGGISIGDELKQNWHIFSPHLTPTQITTILKSIVRDSEYARGFGVEDELFSSLVFIPELTDSAFVEKQSMLSNMTWEEFCEEIKYSNRYHPKPIKEDIFWELFGLLKATYDANTFFYRARLSKQKDFFNENDLRMPPKDLRKAGRIASDGIPCFYLANEEETSICEVRGGAHDIVSIGTFSNIKPIQVIDLRNINNISPFNVSSILLYRINIKLLDSIKKEIEKPLRSSDSSLDYVPIQFICDYIRAKKYDGIVYRSTIRENGFNLSAFDDSAFVCKEIKRYTITKIDYDFALSEL